MSTTPISTRILFIVAGTNEPSNANFLADSMIKAMAASPHVTIEKRRLQDLRISHFDLHYYGPNPPLDDMQALGDLIVQADGIVIASPIWNFSIPAHLKNMIDRMGAFALDESRSVGTLNGKPFFLLYTGGMPKTAWRFLHGLVRHVPVALQYFGGSILGSYFEGGCTLKGGKFGLVVDTRPASLQAVQEKGMAFLRTVEIVKKTGILPLKYRLIKKFVRLSQQIKKKLGL